jgi:hypothetical protein
LSVSPPRRPLPLAAVNGGTGAERSSGVEWTDDETRESERGRWSELVSLLVVEAFVLALNCTWLAVHVVYGHCLAACRALWKASAVFIMRWPPSAPPASHAVGPLEITGIGDSV